MDKESSALFENHLEQLNQELASGDNILDLLEIDPNFFNSAQKREFEIIRTSHNWWIEIGIGK